MTTVNGGNEGTMPFTNLRQIYDVFFSSQKFKSSNNFRKAIQGYASGKTVATSLAYAPNPIQRPDGTQFNLPSMTFVGYTPAEQAILDQFYGALVNRIHTDTGFAQHPAIRALAETNGESLFSLRAPKTLGGTDDNTRGVAAPDSWDNDHQVETIVQTKDLNLKKSAGKTEFLLRAFHEFLHESFLHYQPDAAYDNSKSLVENLTIELNVNDVLRVDLAYGGARDVLNELSSQLGLTTTEIDKISKGLVKDKVDKYNERRVLLARAKGLERFNDNTTPDGILNPAELNALVSAKVLKLKKPPADVDTPEELEAYRADKANYEPTKKGLKNYQKEKANLGQIKFEADGGVFDTFEDAVAAAIEFAKDFFGQYSSEIGQALGSNLGRLVATGRFEQTVASVTLGVVGQNLGEVVENVIDGDSLQTSIGDAFSNLPQDLLASGIGAISSFLTAELFEELDIGGTLGELGQSAAASALTAIIQNIGAITAGTKTITEVVSGINVFNIIGSYIGTRLASELVEFDTIGGQIGSAVGSAVGVTIGAAAGLDGMLMGMKLGAFAGPIGALIGAFIGFILGGVIGSLFGGTPRSGADMGWDAAKGEFVVGRVWSKSGGSKDAARSFASSVAEVLNGVLTATGSKVIDIAGVRTGSYGTHKKDFVYWATGGTGVGQVTFKTRNPDDLINHGAAIGVADLTTRLMGGDVYVKRAIAATVAQSGGNPASNSAGAAGQFTVSGLLGNISTAQDYASYLQNPDPVNALIAAEPDSTFTASWSITFARALELGLMKRGATDWIGGWTAFLDEKIDGKVDGIALTPANMGFTVDPATGERLFVLIGPDGELVGVAGDTIDTAGKDKILGTAGADTITVTGDRITNASGLTINGAAATGQHIINVAARIEAGGGNDTIIAGDLGNDVSGGDGNDTLVGGKLDDWLFGDAGNDRLFAGAANPNFLDGNTAATAAAISVAGNGDMLDGGAGDDSLYGSAGSDWLKGGAGVDLIIGGSGGDVIEGGAGDDRGSGNEAKLLGGAGTDQYVFGRGDGHDVAFDESDNATPGSSGDSLHTRIQNIEAGAIRRNWAGGGDYERDGSIKGGEDTVAFGPGIGFQDLLLRRSGTAGAPGQDLIIELDTGDTLTIRDWFESTRRVEWLRFSNGEEIRIGDISSFFIGTAEADIILGTGGADFLWGGAGNDALYGLEGNDFGFGGTGNDFVGGDEDNDLVSGGNENDKVLGDAGNDTVFGDAGNDTVYGGLGADIVVGGRGDDEVAGGAGNDVIRYERGDGRDTVFDDFANNWELVWQNGSYTNGYSLDQATGMVSKGGTVVFDGAQWLGLFDWANQTRTFRRHLGAVGGVLTANSGTDSLEFGVGIDIQDLLVRRNGNDLEIAIGSGGGGDARSFDTVDDRITIRDWYVTGAPIENFVFAATGRHAVSTWTITGAGTDAADTLTGTTGIDWITGNGGDDVISGNGSADILSGNGGADVISGGAGDDVLYGGDADDVLDGGAGADTLIGGPGTDIASYASATATGMRAFLNAPATNTLDGAGDTYDSIEGIEGTSGNDKLGGDINNNILRGLGGNDTLYGGAGDDIYEIELANGQDTILDAPFVTEQILDSSGTFNSAQYTATWTDLGFGSTAQGNRFRYRLVVTRNDTGEEVYRSRDAVDFIFLSAVPTVPAGTAWPFADGQWLNGSARTGNGAQVAREIFQPGNGGNDTLEFGSGIGLSDLTFARLNGGADLQITYATSNFVTITGQNDPNRAIESVQFRDGLVADLTKLRLVGEAATSDGDFMVGDGGANILEGLAGDDVLSGGAGSDTLRGGDGDDILEGGLNNDSLDGGSDSVTSGAAPPTDPSRPYGDTIRYVRSTAGVNISLENSTASGGHATGDTIVRVGTVSSIENVVGSEGFTDTLIGDSRANRLFGLGGNDTLDGRGGNDVLSGGTGNDTLRGADGDDNLTGDDGNDTLRGGNNNDLLFGGSGIDDLQGDDGDDVLSGGDDDDTLDGGAGDDTLGGDGGADTLYGLEGSDDLVGGAGNDTLYGGDDLDTLAGGEGDDFLFGELGDDDYIFDANGGTDIVFDSDGRNRIVIEDATPAQIWLSRVGDDLRIGFIGGTASLTVQACFTPDASVMREVALATHSLFLSASHPLIDAMTAISSESPAEMPEDIADLLENYWIEGGQSSPIVTDQTVETNEDTAVTGFVGATDPDGNIVSYEVQTQPGRGAVTIDATTGDWTYTPGANVHGEDSFEIVVIDADDNRATQTVTVTIHSVNDAPSDIALGGSPAGIPERDHPPQGTLLEPIVLGTLTATDVDAPDSGDFASHVFSVTDSRFEVVNGNVLRLRGGVALDFETTPTVSVAVTVTDRNGGPLGLSFTKTFTFNVLDQDDYFYGTSGVDTITGQSGRNFIYGFAGNDVLTGANVVDTIEGGDGTDQLFGLDGDDSLDGGLGDDALEGGGGNDTLRGGDGTDALFGQAGNDTMFGDGGADQLFGDIGDDQLDGGGDNDRLEGGAGNDRLVGGTQDDTLLGGLGADRFLGGAGVDTVSYETATSGITVNLATGTGTVGDAAGDIFEDTPEILIGSAFADTITGSAGSDIIEGRTGDDVIFGGAGADILRGGDGNDTIDAQSGDDTLDGGAGSDILIGGDDSDTYLMNVGSGVDEIRNFDPNGTDIDVIGYQDIDSTRLWFERSGNDFIVTVIETGVRTTVKDWYLVSTASERANYKIDFIIAGNRFSKTIDAEMLVTLMAGYPRPTTQTQYNTLHNTPAFEETWRTAWKLNEAPTVGNVDAQTINEDGTLTLTVRITDDFTPAAGVTVTATAVRVDDNAVEDLRFVNAPTIGAPNSAGDRTLTVTTKPNASGQVAIKLRAVDAGGVATERVFVLTINPVADTPIVTLLPPATPVSPMTKPSLDSGSWPVNLDASLVDQDGSETLEIRIANVPSGLSFNAGTILSGDGNFSVWSFTRAQLTGLRIQGPATWAQDLALSVTAVARESNGQVALSAPVALNIEINARPTDIASGTLAFNENAANGTVLTSFTRMDPDAGDTATFTLLDNAGGRFALSTAGVLSASTTPLNYEAASSHTIRVQVTDSGGLTRIEDFVVQVNDVNEPLSLGGASFSVNENVGVGTLVGTVSATDPDTLNPAFRNFRYRLIGGDTGSFTIDQVSGQIRTAAGIDYESRQNYSVTVEAWDGGAIGSGFSSSASVSISVGNVNEAPTITTSGFTVPEGTHGGPGSVLAQVGGAAAVVQGTDPEGASLRYQLIGGDTGVFSIEQNGTMHLQSTLDFETRTSYSVTVRAWDGGALGAGNAADRTISISVANVNEGPKITAFNSVGSESLGFPSGSLFHFGFTAVDPEGNAIVSAVNLNLGTNVTIGDSSLTPTNDTLFIATLSSILTTQQPTYTIRLTDSLGVSADTTVQLLVGPPRAVIIGPVVLDLDGDGIELEGQVQSGVQFDMNDDSVVDPTGWIGAGDAFLALDRNRDGVISKGSEISFTQDLPGAQTDLEGLAAFDTNDDGYFGADDERFAEFKVWQDANHDGISQAGELTALASRDIRAINLTRTLTGAAADAGGNTLHATSEFVRGDGSIGTVGDVSLGYLGMDITVNVIDPDDAEAVNRTADDDNLPLRRGRFLPIDGLMNEAAARLAQSYAGRDDREARIGSGPVPEDESSAPQPKRPEWRMEAGSHDRSWEQEINVAPAPSALHSALTGVAHRRLQMIEAMASFDAEGAAALDLLPQRRLDAKTYDLLTAVSLTAVSLTGRGSAAR